MAIGVHGVGEGSNTMTNNEFTGFQRSLEYRRAELTHGTHSREILAVENSSDDLDRSQQASERDFAVSGIQRNESQLRLVLDALGRTKDGTYGVCIACDGDIRLKRLAAVPWAAFCINCQEEADRLERNPGSGHAAHFDMAA